jgi:hypothetical protein
MNTPDLAIGWATVTGLSPPRAKSSPVNLPLFLQVFSPAVASSQDRLEVRAATQEWKIGTSNQAAISSDWAAVAIICPEREWRAL